MQSAVLIEKKEGETPLQALERLRLEEGISKDTPMTYAGRLDPMASGLLLILIGEECKRKEVYLGLDKEYEFQILLGFSSDTGDILGIPTRGEDTHPPHEAIERIVGECIGTYEMEYPLFSSKTVDGRPLFSYGLEKDQASIEIPKRAMTVHSISCLGMRAIQTGALLKDIRARIHAFTPPESDLQGSDFRKEGIETRWQEVLKENGEYVVLHIKASVGAGTYIRALAPEIARRLGTSGLAYAIRRTRIGNLAQTGIVV